MQITVECEQVIEGVIRPKGMKRRNCRVAARGLLPYIGRKVKILVLGERQGAQE